MVAAGIGPQTHVASLWRRWPWLRLSPPAKRPASRAPPARAASRSACFPSLAQVQSPLPHLGRRTPALPAPLCRPRPAGHHAGRRRGGRTERPALRCRRGAGDRGQGLAGMPSSWRAAGLPCPGGGQARRGSGHGGRRGVLRREPLRFGVLVQIRKLGRELTEGAGDAPVDATAPGRDEGEAPATVCELVGGLIQPLVQAGAVAGTVVFAGKSAGARGGTERGSYCRLGLPGGPRRRPAAPGLSAARPDRRDGQGPAPGRSSRAAARRCYPQAVIASEHE